MATNSNFHEIYDELTEEVLAFLKGTDVGNHQLYTVRELFARYKTRIYKGRFPGRGGGGSSKIVVDQNCVTNKHHCETCTPGSP